MHRIATTIANSTVQNVVRTISVAATLYAIKLIAGVHIDTAAAGADTQRWEIYIVKNRPGAGLTDITVSNNLETSDVMLIDAGTLRGSTHEVHEVNEKLNFRRKVDAGDELVLRIRSDAVGGGTARSISLDGILTYWLRVR